MAENKIVYAGRTYVHDDITSGGCHIACSLIAEELSVDTLEADVRSTDTSLTNFTRGAPLLYYHGSALISKFYVSDIERTAVNLYRISATSALGLLNEREHLGGIYTGQTAADILADLMPSEIRYSVDARIGRVKMYGWLPIAPIRDNLLQVLFALGANLLKDANGDLMVSALSKDVAGSILEDRVFPGGSVERLTPATRVDVTEHQYIPGTEETVLYEGTTSPEEIIKFGEPMHSLVATGATILRSGANYAVLSAGTATLSGKKYTHTQKIVSAVDKTAPVGEENTHTVPDMTLVSLVNSGSVAERALAYYALKETVTQDIEVGPEKPGDIAQMVHPFGGTILGDIEDMEVTFGSFLRAKTVMRAGFIPLTPPGNLYENMVVLSESCTWIAPAGCTRIRGTLIGDAEDGENGGWGSNGGAAGNGYAGQGGEGGRGGRGGQGGKIREFEMPVVEGRVYEVRISANGATIFGDFSSADGDSLPGGYTEITTGIVYGAAGRDGYQGASGRAGTASGSSVTGSIRPPNGSTYYSSSPIGQVGTAGSGGRAYLETSYIPGPGGVGGAISLTCTAALGLAGNSGSGGGNGSTFGCGGNGGNGGGGGHGAGGYNTSLGKGSSVSFGGAGTLSISSATFGTAAGGKAGYGGPGGKGAKGCAIIYF